MFTDIDYPEVTMLKAHRREKGWKRNNQDLTIRRLKRREKRERREATKLTKTQKWISSIVRNIQNIILECEFNDEDTSFANHDEMLSFFVKRGVVCWDRNRHDEPSKIECSKVEIALKQAQDDGIVKIVRKNKRLQPINIAPLRFRGSTFSLAQVASTLPSNRYKRKLAS